MVPQIVPVGSGFLLRFPESFDLPHRLTDLQIQAVLQLLQMGPGLLLLRQPRQKHQIRHAAHKGHELHHSRISVGKEIRIDPGQIVKGVIQGRRAAELALDGHRIAGNGPHCRCRPQQQEQQWQRHDQLHRILHPISTGKHPHADQRQPPPELAAEIRRQHGDHRPEPLMAQQAEGDRQRKMSMEGVEIRPQRRVDPQIDDPLDQENGQGGSNHAADVPPGPPDVAEGGGEHDAEQSHRHGITRIKDRIRRHVRNTCFLRKAYSKYRSFNSAYFPRGTGSSARESMVMAFGTMDLM